VRSDVLEDLVRVVRDENVLDVFGLNV